MGGQLRRALAASCCGALALLILPPHAASAAADTTPPDPPIITGPSGRVASTSADISVTPADPSDTVACFYNGEEVNCPGSWTIIDLEQGPHTVTATSYDAANNASATVYVYWVVDTVGPVGTTIAPSGLTTKATVSFDENVGGVSGSSVRLVTDAGNPVPASRSCVTNTLEPRRAPAAWCGRCI